ncbi:hypothetical protein [Haladaptatus caseinilyticus]|uniref:hypothetical protein n=1 Tax=Haladaptatus caseinilyticus TaxID=2993314 RepID=UPI00224A868C|nr:hypothetical protein [Haladaptatus caseinilyticus]
MTEQVDKNEELSDRFSTRSKPKSDTEDAEDTDDEKNTGDTGSVDSTGHTGDTDGKDDTSGKGDIDDPKDTGDTGSTGEINGTSHSGHTGDTDSTRNRTQYVMYLPDDLQQELNDLYDQYNGQSLVNGNGGIEKHKDFLEGLVRAGLDNENLDEYIDVKE